MEIVRRLMKIIKYMVLLIAVLFSLIFNTAHAQRAGYWQQEVDYKMDIQMDVRKNQLAGSQSLVYSNNSPDTLDRVFYHLYYNAFQPGSKMDIRSRTVPDPDPRVGDRISKLKSDEIGYQHILSLQQDGKSVEYTIIGTIMDVKLANPVLPGESSTFEMKFESQVPLQVRRTGRDNKEGIRYSMSQFYPKICNYDERGWHPTPYIGREFYSTWGRFDVTITIDDTYKVAATGSLQDAEHYQAFLQGESIRKSKGQRAWRFVAEDVPDFVWAADPDYTYHTERAANGVQMEFFYQKTEATEAWEHLPRIMSEVFEYADTHFGPYPYDRYAFIQGGDGGMEYPMATLITGHRSLTSLVGVSIHELMHSWYQLVLGSNESLYPWMDEGFTSYASTRIMNHLRLKNLLPGNHQENPFESSYKNYARIVESGLEEPLTTHADHYSTNYAYGVAAYTKGAIFLHQLEYIVGKEVFDKALLKYFHIWKFKHPTDLDVIRVFEKESGMILDWYYEYWVQSVKWIDYGIADVSKSENKTVVQLKRSGFMPMPIDVYVTSSDGTEWVYTIPLTGMMGQKKSDGSLRLQKASSWSWVHPDYELEVNIPLDEILEITIDRSGRLADINLENNTWRNLSSP